MTGSNRDEIDGPMDQLRRAYAEANAAGDQGEMGRLAKELVGAAGETKREAKKRSDAASDERGRPSEPDRADFMPPRHLMAESGDAETECDAPTKDVGKRDELELLEAAGTEEEIVTAALRMDGAAGDEIPTYAEVKRWLEDLTAGGVNDWMLSLLTFPYSGKPHVWLPTVPIGDPEPMSDDDLKKTFEGCECTEDGESDDCRVHVEPVESMITLCRILDDGESQLVEGLQPTDKERQNSEKLSEREWPFAFRLVLLLKVQARESDEQRSVALVPVGSISRLHEWWLALRREERLEHPVMSLGKALRASKEGMLSGEPNRHRFGIMGAPFARRTRRRMRMNECLPTLNPPLLPGEVRLPDTACLPGLEPNRPEIATLLTLFDPESDKKMLRGRPIVSHHQHMYVEGLLSAPREGRSDRQEYAVPIREIASEWLQWSERNYRADHRDYGVTLRESIKEINKRILPIDDSGFYYPLLVRGVSGLKWDDVVVFQAHFPPGSDVGAAIDRKILRILFKRSPLAYRGYLSLCFEWDRYGARRGKLIRPTLPVVRRSNEGYVVNAEGKILTGKGGVPVRSPYDERAIRTGARSPNPGRKRYPVYASDDLVRLCYPAYEAVKPATRRKWRGRAWRAIEMIEKVGGCFIERIGTGKDKDSLPWRVMPPDWAE